MLVFDGFFGSYALRQLVVDHINYNKNLCIDNIEGDLANTLKKLWRIGWNSQIICILKHDRCSIELWCDVKNSWIRYLQILYLIKKKINVHFH